MGTDDVTQDGLTAADYAAGLRALADAIEKGGMPASRSHPDAPFTMSVFVESPVAVRDFAAAYGLTVEENERHTSAALNFGPHPSHYYGGSATLRVIHIDKSDEHDQAEEPTSDRRTYDCGCGYMIVDDSDDVDGFHEAVNEHQETCSGRTPGGENLLDTHTAEAAEHAPELSDEEREAIVGAELTDDATTDVAGKIARLLAIADEVALADNHTLAQTLRVEAYHLAHPAEPKGPAATPPIKIRDAADHGIKAGDTVRVIRPAPGTQVPFGTVCTVKSVRAHLLFAEHDGELRTLWDRDVERITEPESGADQ